MYDLKPKSLNDFIYKKYPWGMDQNLDLSLEVRAFILEYDHSLWYVSGDWFYQYSSPFMYTPDDSFHPFIMKLSETSFFRLTKGYERHVAMPRFEFI